MAPPADCSILQFEIVADVDGALVPLDIFHVEAQDAMANQEALVIQISDRAAAAVAPASLHRLVYQDDEGDWCSLSKETLHDALSFAKTEDGTNGIGKLQVQVKPGAALEAPVTIESVNIEIEEQPEHVDGAQAVKIFKTDERQRVELPVNVAAKHIIRAWYGAPGHEWTEIQGKFITDKLRRLIAQGEIVHANSSHFNDPAQGIDKILLVEAYEEPAFIRKWSYSVEEHKELRLPLACSADNVARAWWGAPSETGEWTDELGKEVTEQVKASAEKRELICANNDIFGDPAFGIGKALTVEVEMMVLTFVVEEKENHTLRLPERYNEDDVIRAWYGEPGNEWTESNGRDVTRIVKQVIREGGIVKASIELFEDPAEGLIKVLMVETSSEPSKRPNKERFWHVDGPITKFTCYERKTLKLPANCAPMHVVRASYGTPGRNVDVTQKVRRLLAVGEKIRALNTHFGDPHQGEQKELCVEAYTIEPKMYKTVVRALEQELPFELPQEFGVEHVMRAWYGAVSDWSEDQGKDVTETVKTLLKEQSQFVASNDHFGDPCPGLGKALLVEVGAEAIQFVVDEKHNEFLDLPTSLTADSVIRAWYGEPGHEWTESNGADVTGVVKELVGSGKTRLSAKNDVFGDLAPGIEKVLFVEILNLPSYFEDVSDSESEASSDGSSSDGSDDSSDDEVEQRNEGNIANEVLMKLNQLGRSGADLRQLLPELAAAVLRVIEAVQEPELYQMLDVLMALRDGEFNENELPSVLTQLVAVVCSLAPEKVGPLLKRIKTEATQVFREFRPKQQQKTHQTDGVEVHTHVTCDGCEMNPIVGPRYKSLVQDDYDVCTACHALTEQKAEEWVRVQSDQRADVVGSFYAPPATSADDQPVHHYIQCDGCDVYPIVGRRFKCLDLEDYDLCETCRPRHDNPEHRFHEITAIHATVATVAAAEADAKAASETPKEKRDIAAVEEVVDGLGEENLRAVVKSLLQHKDERVCTVAMEAICSEQALSENKLMLTVLENGEVELPDNAVVIRAWYGAPGQQWCEELGRHVTEEVRSLAQESRKLKASNANFGDPAPGIQKVLAVEAGREQKMECKDHEAGLCAELALKTAEVELLHEHISEIERARHEQAKTLDEMHSLREQLLMKAAENEALQVRLATKAAEKETWPEKACQLCGKTSAWTRNVYGWRCCSGGWCRNDYVAKKEKYGEEWARQAVESGSVHQANEPELVAEPVSPAPSAKVISGESAMLGIEADQTRGAIDVTEEFAEIIAACGARQAFSMGRVQMPVADGEPASVPACFKVLVVNDGEVAWPETTCVTIVHGDDLGFPVLNLDAFQPGEAAEIVLDLVVPQAEEPKSIRSTWAIVDSSTGCNLGPLLMFEADMK